jgi:hypothetical protein
LKRDRWLLHDSLKPLKPMVQMYDSARDFLFRTDALYGTSLPGDNCLLDAAHFCLGGPWLKACHFDDAAKMLYGENFTRGQSRTFAALSRVFEENGLPFSLEKDKTINQSFKALLNKTEGIRLVRCEVLHSGGARALHFFGIDAWRRIIFNNNQDPRARYCLFDDSDCATKEAAKALFRQLCVVELLEVYVVKVRASRVAETSFV